ncbi:MAG: type VI secretion protein, partial [Burkholderiales bacterium 34-67-9]
MTTDTHPSDEERTAKATPSAQAMELERGPADFGDTRKSAPRGARAFLWLTGLIATAITLGFIFHRYAPGDEAVAASDLNTTTSGITNRLEAPQLRRPPPAREAAASPAPAPAPLPIIVQAAPVTAPGADPVTERRLASPLQADGAGQTAAGSGTRTQTVATPMQDAGPLA